MEKTSQFSTKSDRHNTEAEKKTKTGKPLVYKPNTNFEVFKDRKRIEIDEQKLIIEKITELRLLLYDYQYDDKRTCLGSDVKSVETPSMLTYSRSLLKNVRFCRTRSIPLRFNPIN